MSPHILTKLILLCKINKYLRKLKFRDSSAVEQSAVNAFLSRRKIIIFLCLTKENILIVPNIFFRNSIRSSRSLFWQQKLKHEVNCWKP